MTIEVEIAGTGQIAEFPDGTPPEVIQQAMSNLAQPQAAPQAPAPDMQSLLTQFNQAQQAGDFQTAEQIKQQINKAQSGAIGGAFEAAGTIGSGIVAEPIAGLAGVVQSVNPFADPGAGAEAVQSTREALTFQPRTEEGLQALQGVGETLAPVGEALEDVSAGLGDKVFEQTGSPFLSTLAYALPTAALEAGGFKLTKPARNAARTSKRLKRFKDIEKISTNPQSAKNVEVMVREGKRVADKAAKEAINQGFDPATVAFAKGAEKADRAKFLKMTQIKKKALDDLRFAADNRPSDVVGDSLAKRVNHIAKVNKSAGKRLDGVAKKLKGETVDISQPRQRFIDQIADEGVSTSVDDAGRTVADFAGSTFEDVGAPQEAINSMLKRLDRLGDTSDALQAHRAKRFIDEGITLGGKAGEGLRGRSQGIILELRKGIDDALDADFRDYKRVNDAYSKTIGALNNFQDSVGKRVNLTGKNASTAIGQESRKLLSNYNTRVRMMDSLKEIEDLAIDTGLKVSDDILSQTMYADILDRSFGTSAQRSLAGETAKGFSGPQLLQAGADPVTGALIGGAKLIDKLKGKSPEKAFKALESMLAR